MIRKNWLEMFSRAASVVLIVLFTFSIVGSGAHAQSAQSVTGVSLIKPVAPPAFLVAPSVSLGYSPTSIASGALTSSGRTDLVTADSNAGKITVFIGQGRGTFSPGVSYAAGAQPSSLVIADVDGDGLADVVLANPTEGVISVFPGNGNGTLGARKTYAIGFAPSFVAVGDFTGSGKMDVAVAGASGKSLAILQNTGTGTLSRPVNYALPSEPTALIAADFNHDGHLDLAIAGTAGTVTIFLGKGNGQFTPLPDISVASSALSSIAAGDFNRDGNLDLVVTSAVLNQAGVLLGQGNGKFGAATMLDVGNSPVTARIADVDGDGIPDVVVINKGGSTFSVLAGVGDGTFKNAAQFVVGNAPLGVAAADFYGNGHVDLATINQLGQTLSIPASKGDGTFVAGRAYPAGVQPVAVASGDLTKSGRSDMVVASYCAKDSTCGGSGGVTVLLAGPSGVYQLGSSYTMGTGSIAIRLLDVNGDGKLDMVALNRVDRSISLRLGAGDGTFGTLMTIPLASSPIALTAADFNKDGKVDLAVVGDCGTAACSQPGMVEFLLGSGDGNFRSVSTHPVGYAPVAVATGITSPGGNIDVIAANRCGIDAACKSGGTATLLFGNGTGDFTAGADVALGNSPSSIALADLRGLGIPDLVVSRSTDNTVAVLPGTGKGTFAAAVPYAVGHAPGALVVADFNGDGQPDVAVANTADSSVSVLFGKTGGTLQTAFAVPVSGNPAALAAIPSATGRASLATPSGSIATPAAASNVTVVANLVARPAAVVNVGAFTLTVTPAGALTVNQSVTLAATATAAGGNGTPAGNVRFQVSVTGAGGPFADLSDCGAATGLPLDGAGVATCVTQQLPGNAALVIQANYLGDGGVNYNPATSNQVTRVVNAAASGVTLTSNPAAPTTDQVITLTAKVSPTTAPAVVTDAVTIGGTLAFNDTTTATTLCAATNVIYDAATGTASLSCTVPVLTVATHNLTAAYSGDTNYSGSSGPLSLAVTAAPSKVSVSPAPSPGTVNGSVTFSVSVDPNVTGTQSVTANLAPIAGSVMVLDGVTAISGCSNAPITYNAVTGTATASCSSDALTAGSHSITAQFTPTGTDYLGSTSTPAVNLTINKAATTLTVAASAATPVNSNATFTATLGGSFTSTKPTTGSAVTSTVAFYADGSGTAISGCSASQLQLNAGNYIATCTTNSLNATTHSISATYSGDNNFATSSTTAPQTTYAPTKLTGTLAIVSAPAGTTTVGTSVTFTATFTVSSVSPFAPGGNVSFTINGAADARCPAVAINASQQATCTTTGLTTGNYQIAATYAGDSNFNSATSSAVPLTETKAAPTVAVNANAVAPFAVNQSILFTATAANPGTGAQTVQPTGTVTFKQGATTLCANSGLDTTVTPPQATCTHSFPSSVTAPGVVTATYNGDSNFSSNSATTTGTVNAASTTTVINSSGTVNVGQAVTYTTTITPQFAAPPSYPQGTVTFTTNANPAPTGTCTSPLTVSATGTVANCTLIFSTGGPFNVSAQFTPSDSNFTTSTSSTVVQAVNTGSLGINLTSNTSPSSVNQPVTFSAAFTPSVPNPVPAGNVTYADNGTTLCTVAISGTGTIPSCTVTFTTAGSHSIIASLPANGTYNAASSNTLAQVVNKNQVASAISATLSSASVNQQVTFTATLTAGTFPGATGTLSVPSGTLTFNATSTAGTISPCSNVPIVNTAGVLTAQCSTTFATIGTYTVVATYNGDTNFTQGAAGSTQVVVGTAGTSVSVTPPTGITFYVNETTGVTFAASVIPNPTGSVAPTGSMTFSDSVGGTDLCIPQTVQPDGSGGAKASCPIIFRSAGAHTITATYGGDTNFPTASNTTAVTVNATHMSISTSSGGIVPANQAVTYTTTLTPAFAGAGATIPKGNVTFASSPATTLTGTCLPSVALALDGSVPACTLIFPSAGSFAITATFNPSDTNFATNTSAGVTQTISKAPANLVVAAPVPVVTNQAVTLTAAFSPAITGTQPTRTVTYYDGATAISGCTVTLAAGVIPACQTHFTTAAAHSITAVYVGDANFNTQTSAVVTQAVNQAPTTAAVTSSSGVGATATSAVNQQVTFTATITPQFPDSALAVPTGTVAFYDNNNLAAPICQGVSVAPGAGGVVTATCAYTFTATGTNTISAAYSGDSNFVAVAQLNSTPLTQTVIAPNTTIAVTPPASATVNQKVTFSLVITPTSKGVTVPTGKVTFADNDPTTLMCAPASLAGDSASGTSTTTCDVIFLNAGTHKITATYAGDNNFAAPSAVPSSVTVSASATTLTLQSSSPVSFATQAVTYSAKVTPTPSAAANLAVALGTVTFSSGDGTVQLSCAQPVALKANGDGTASAICTATFPHLATPAGAVDVTAVYNDSLDANFTSSNSTLSQTVQDFNVSLTVTPQAGSVSVPTAIYLTPGYGTTQNGSVKADPWGAVTIASAYALSTGFTSPDITITCSVYAGTPPDLTKPPLQDPTCATLQQTPGQWQFAVNASEAATGLYTVYFTTYDRRYNNQNLVLPQSVLLYVVGRSSTLSLGAGSQGTQNLNFNTALAGGGDSISTFGCGQIVDSAGAVLPNTNLISCSGAAGQSVSGPSSSLSVTISTSPSKSALVASSSPTTYAAVVFGIPVLALLGWFGSRKSPRRSLYRFFSLMVLLFGLSYATGCGGSFHTSAPPVPNGIQPGSYQVQVIATGTSGKNYYAVVPLQVNAIQ
jgi:large repetitive protein